MLVSQTGAYTINDTTDVGRGRSGHVDSSYYYTDVVGDKAIFDLLGIVALVNNGSLILDIYTNFPES